MSWKYAYAFVMGTSHITTNTPCQDYAIIDTTTAPNGDEYFLSFCSDGAGSAKMSKEGAELACRTAVDLVKQAIAGKPVGEPFTEKEVIHWVHEVIQVIRHTAYSGNLKPRDYACTLLGVVAGPNQSICLQMGDGAIILHHHNAYGLVFRPNSGEYVNATFTLTDVNGLENLKVQFVDFKLEQFVMFTDGVQPLGLNLNTGIPHVPFFEPMLNYMRNPKIFNPNTINSDLAKFLGTDKVNERTEDDKTLILATRL